MLKKPAYFVLGYMVILFLIYRFVTDQDVPLYRILIKVLLSGVCILLIQKVLDMISKPRLRKRP